MTELLTSADCLDLATSRLLKPAGLALDSLDGAFARLLGPGIDFGDLYFQHARRESWVLEDGIVKEGVHAIDQGLGVRAISGEKTGFAYSDDIRVEALLEAAGAARAISRSGAELSNGAGLRVGNGAPARASLYMALDPVDGMDADAKVLALQQIDRMLRAADPRVRQVTVSLSGGV
ncbi:MAG: DNA gyrase modulator, partial [Lysobacteraceae bacterium]